MTSARVGLGLGVLCAFAACSCPKGAGSDGGGRDGGDLGRACTPQAPCAAPLVCVQSGICLEDGGCAESSDCLAGELCDAGACVPGSVCGGQHLGATVVPPNLLITLDRSCSMTQDPDGGKGTSKWSIAVIALTDLLTETDGQAQFGLTLFPERDAGADGGDTCEVASETVSLGPGNEVAIANLLSAADAKTDRNYPSGPCVTPIDSGLHESSTDPALADTSRRSFLILITDGEQTSNCKLNGGAAGCVSTIAALAARTPAVNTFVVGFGSEVNAAELGAFAKAGGEPAMGATEYYQAEDQASLEAALATITGKTLGCVLQLASTPPNSSALYVFFDGQPVTEDPTQQNGWDYDAADNEVILYGAACQEVQSGSVTAVDVEFGCSFN